MRIFELFQPINEGYKEAQADFEKVADADAVEEVLDTYKQLVNKNQYQGSERNIDYWRKQGWAKFSNSVKTVAARPTRTEIKRGKNPGKSITLAEDNTWLIVIPLDKNASCFHGKGTDWCTTKPFANFYETYFYRNNVTLIYFLNKTTGNKWAIAAQTPYTGSNSFFDKNDHPLDQETFDAQTMLDSQKYINMALGNTHQASIAPSRDEYKRRVSYIEAKLPFRQEDPKVEEYLLYIKHVGYILKYCINVKGRWPEAEPIIMRDAANAFLYAKEIIGGRWKEAEPYIFKSLGEVDKYILEFIGTRMPDAEPIIMRNPIGAARYAVNVLGKKWPAAEPAIFSNVSASLQYVAVLDHNEKLPKEMEDKIMRLSEDNDKFLDYKDWVAAYAVKAYDRKWHKYEQYILEHNCIEAMIAYAQDVMGRRWLDAEALLKNDPYVWKFYTRKLDIRPED